jgi:phosphoglucomutase
MTDFLGAYRQWLEAAYIDDETKKELSAITDTDEIKDRFYKELEFGTGGLRGIMGAGLNRLNIYTIRKVTFGLANYIRAERGEAGKSKGVVIAYDSRNNSRKFALEAAQVLCACGIKTFLFDTLQPTPVLSFSVRALNCAAGIVITASHNPKEYNGYKIYDHYGGQVVPRDADIIIKYIQAVQEFDNIPILMQHEALDKGLLQIVGDHVLLAFLEAVKKQSLLSDNRAKEQLHIVYTPLHGSGNIPVRKILTDTGFTHVSVVREQEAPDGGFPTVSTPNPEDKAALAKALLQARQEKADIVLGTDPDCDRVGVAVLHKDDYVLLTGNQLGALLVSYVLSEKKQTLDKHPVLIKTIVTNELGASIGRQYGLEIVDTLTGFKYIGDKISQYEQTGEHTFVIGYEESFGYLVGTHARDKDAVVASLLICEMAAFHKKRGQTLCEVLEGLYEQYGYYLDALDSYACKGPDGAQRINDIMSELRHTGNRLLPNIKNIRDYLEGIDCLPQENVLKYILSDDSWIAVRPSGTEPKIKVYYSIKAADKLTAQNRLIQIKSRLGEFIRL